MADRTSPIIPIQIHDDMGDSSVLAYVSHTFHYHQCFKPISPDTCAIQTLIVLLQLCIYFGMIPDKNIGFNLKGVQNHHQDIVLYGCD